MERRGLTRDNGLTKLSWQGKLIAVQPRIRLLRSFDQRNHSYLGYALRVKGLIDDQEQEFLVGIGKGAQAKHMFHVGDVVFGQCLPVEDSRTETVEFYKAGPTRKVPGRKGMSWEEEDWVDEDAVSHRSMDE